MILTMGQKSLLILVRRFGADLWLSLQRGPAEFTGPPPWEATSGQNEPRPGKVSARSWPSRVPRFATSAWFCRTRDLSLDLATINVRQWHLADIDAEAEHVRSQG